MGRRFSRKALRAYKKMREQQTQQNQQVQQQNQKQEEINQNPINEQIGSGLGREVGLENVDVDFTQNNIQKTKPQQAISQKDKLTKMLKIK